MVTHAGHSMNAKPLELRGGVECTVNRVGDRVFDQMERNGHACASRWMISPLQFRA